MAKPTFSVVTAAFNSARHIRQTLESVAAQTGVSCEHVVADGGSTDGTQAVIEEHIRPGGKWHSAPDAGIADAMNKGIALSAGEWLLFLQSDDFLTGDGILAEVGRHLSDDVDICAFPVRYGSDSSSRVAPPRGAGPWLNFKTGLMHQGAFIRRSLFDRLGGYDTSFRIAMDYEFFLRAYRAGARFRCYREPVVAFMRDSGISGRRDWSGLAPRLAEEQRIHRKLQTPALKAAYAAWWALYPRYRRFLAGES